MLSVRDEEIIALFFQRSEQAIKRLDIKYGKLCYRISYNILSSRCDAEECVNDAYLGVWNAIPPARPDPLQAYLCKTVRNISVKRCRKNGAAKRGGSFAVALSEQLDEQDIVRVAASVVTGEKEIVIDE